MFGRNFGFTGPFMMKKKFHAIANQILPLKCGLNFGIGYGIGPKYWPIWVLVLVQNSGFGRTLGVTQICII